VSSFRPPRRSGLRAPWVAGVLAVLIAAALAGAGAAAGAQEADDAGTATSVEGQAPDSSAPDATDTTDDTATDATEPDATDATEPDATDDTEPDATDDTEADDAEDPAADPNGNNKNLPLNSGVQTGTVFNPVPYGEVPGNTPQVLIQRPGSGRIIPLNQELTVRVRFSNFEPGHFSDPASEYGQGTQRLNGQGNVQGHNHMCAQRVSRDGSVPGERCASFVVLQQEGSSDILTGIMPPLTEPGRYRFCADAAAGNHYPATRAFAQRGGPVDCVRVLAMDFAQLRNANQ
jgi:hypothetical protein